MIQAEVFKIEFPCDTDFCLVLAGNRNLAGVRPAILVRRSQVHERVSELQVYLCWDIPGTLLVQRASRYDRGAAQGGDGLRGKRPAAAAPSAAHFRLAACRIPSAHRSCRRRRLPPTLALAALRRAAWAP